MSVSTVLYVLFYIFYLCPFWSCHRLYYTLYLNIIQNSLTIFTGNETVFRRLHELKTWVFNLIRISEIFKTWLSSSSSHIIPIFLYISTFGYLSDILCYFLNWIILSVNWCFALAQCIFWFSSKSSSTLPHFVALTFKNSLRCALIRVSTGLIASPMLMFPLSQGNSHV